MNDWKIEGHICSNHAQKRMQQRGIKKETVEFVLRHGDRQEYVGRDTSSVYLSKKMIGRLSRSMFSWKWPGTRLRTIVSKSTSAAD